MRNIEVIVDRDGSVVIRYNGFAGKTCFDEAMRLYNNLKILGLDVKIERVEAAETYVEGKETVRV